MDIKNRVVVVTGAAGGLGSATAKVFKAAGARVALVDFNEVGAISLAEELGEDTRAYGGDITCENSVQAAVDKIVDDFGAIHACCNIAGGGSAPHKTFGKKGPHPLEDFTKTVNLNIVGTFNMMRFVAQKMAANDPLTEAGERGSIINTASVAAFEGQMGQLAYTAGKAGIAGMNITATRDLSSLGIRVNTIVPGIMGTEIMLGVSDKIKEHLLSSVEFPKRFGFPSEFGKLALHIVENEYLNAACIRLDAGLRAPAR